ncbi:MAG: amino acid decarboxylase, partial [Phaeobacter gallaeciensis]
TDNCRLAALMADEVEKQPRMALGAAVVSNVCVFTARKDLLAAEQTRLNTAIAQDLQESGEAVFSTTRMGDRVLLRAALTNHRTRDENITAAIAAVARRAELSDL